MTNVNINNVTLYYEQIGDKAKPELLLIAGLTCNSLFWAPIVKELGEHFHVTLFDNRGVGRSSAPETPYTIEDMAKDTLALLEHLGIDKAHCLGHSMGGCIAQQLAITHPNKIERLVLSNTLISFKPKSALTQQHILQLRRAGLPISVIAQGIAPWLFSDDFLADHEKVSEFIAAAEQNPYQQTIVGFEGQIGAISRFNSSSFYHKIAVPTLVIGGDSDILCPADSKQLADGIPQAEYYVFQGQGHLPLVEKPELFNRIVINFLLKV